LIIPYKHDKISLLRFTNPVFHYSIIPGWKKKNGWLAIPYYQAFVKIPIYKKINKKEYIKMSMSAEQIYKEALQLPDESKVFLAERLIEYLEAHIDGDVERIHPDTAKRRRDEIRLGQVRPIDGEEALAQVRRIVKT
jgi:hypothetical protein